MLEYLKNRSLSVLRYMSHVYCMKIHIWWNQFIHRCMRVPWQYVFVHTVNMHLSSYHFCQSDCCIVVVDYFKELEERERERAKNPTVSLDVRNKKTTHKYTRIQHLYTSLLLIFFCIKANLNCIESVIKSVYNFSAD